MTRLGRYAPLTGIVFVALTVVAILISSNSPGSSSSGARVISFYTAHKSSQKASDLLFGLGFAFFVFFAGSLYGFLRRASSAHTLATVGLGGALLFALGFALFTGVDYSIADVPGKLSPSAAQALNVLDNDLFLPFALGSIVFGVGMGLSIVVSGLLPAWLGWVLIALGIVSIPVFPLYFVLLLWIVVVSIMIYRRSGEPKAAAAPTPVPAATGA